MEINDISNSTHENIIKKLDHFINIKKIPHIIFHGPCGSGKRTILYDFILKLYNNNKNIIKDYVMYVNCAHTKGIRFIRDELKFFAKKNIKIAKNMMFKSIVLFNAENLTVDAQSALRRCIEKFSNNTRFFIVVENKDSLLKPILSRFCDIFIPYNTLKKKTMKSISTKSYYEIEKNKSHLEYIIKRENWLKKQLTNSKNFKTLETCFKFSNNLYNKGYNSYDLLNYIKNTDKMENKYLGLIYFNKIKKEFRNESNLMFIILYFGFMRKKMDLENILSI